MERDFFIPKYALLLDNNIFKLMKIQTKIWAFCLALIIISCGGSTQSSIEGKIDNLPDYINEITLQTEDSSRTLSIDSEGNFKDTINFKQALVLLRMGSFGKMLFLDKDSQLKITADANDFEKTITYTGTGAIENNYIHQREQITNSIFTSIDSVLKLKEDNFEGYLSQVQQRVETLLNTNKNIHPFLIKEEKESLSSFLNSVRNQYKITNRTASSLEPGSPSPEFNDLQNYKGGTTSLKDLKGNYVYIDIWATWCMPCLQQIPYLQKLEDTFHNKAIKFVSLSIDSPNAESKWKQMIQDKNMGGIQLFAGGSIPFVQDYQVTGIPRFILLDKEGNIVDADAPRPSEPRLEAILTDLLK